MIYLPYAIGFAISLVLWDGVRRYFSDRSEARKLALHQEGVLLSKFDVFRAEQEEFREFLRTRTAVHETALRNFLTEIRDTFKVLKVADQKRVSDTLEALQQRDRSQR